MFDRIREQAARFPRTLNVSRVYRGVTVSLVEKAIRATADKIGCPISSEPRAIRLKLVSEIYERDITSFNELADAEIWALREAVMMPALRRKLYDDLKAWLAREYGEQTPLPGMTRE